MDFSKILNYTARGSGSGEPQAHPWGVPAYDTGGAGQDEGTVNGGMAAEARKVGEDLKRRMDRVQREARVGRLETALHAGRLAVSLGKSFDALAKDGILVRPLAFYSDDHDKDPRKGDKSNYFASMAPHVIQEHPVWVVPADDSIDIDEDEEEEGSIEDDSSTDEWVDIIETISDGAMSLCVPEQEPAATYPTAMNVDCVQGDSPRTFDSGYWSAVNPMPAIKYPSNYHVTVAHRIANGFIDSDRLVEPGLNALTTLIKGTVWYDPTKEDRKENVFGRYTDPRSEIPIPTQYTHEHGWFVRNIFASRQDHPHTMFIIASPESANLDNTLVRGEVTTILTAMISRYKNGRQILKRQKVMPVMLISVIEHRARILQAHYNGDNVVIRVSPLIDPEQEEECDGYDLFSRYLASEPIGDTTVMPKFKKTSQPSKTKNRSADGAGLEERCLMTGFKRLNIGEEEEEEYWSEEKMSYWVTAGATDSNGYAAVFEREAGR
ncbi:hypothetical protein BDV12DRAFT_196786 [Aspergillus spectabilis]